jgi:hypothetical protein
LDEQTFAQVQRQLDVAEAYYAAYPDYDDQRRRILVAVLGRVHRTDPGEERAPVHDAQQGRAYARRLNSAGVREAEKYAQRTIVVAGMLGVPTSTGELALMLALPGGGYLVGKVTALTYKKAALLLRKLRTPEEVLARAGALGIRFERISLWESRGGLRYGADPTFGNRVSHVLSHAADIPTRPGAHGVFDGGRFGTLGVVDEAWALAQAGGQGVTVVSQGTRTIYTVDMGRRVGFIGGQAGAAAGHPAASHVRLVIESSADVITAFPVRP